jgi:cytochrome c5
MRAARRIAAGTLVIAAAVLAEAGLFGEARSQMTRASRRPPTVGKAYANRLPSGPGRELAARACLMCHSASMTTQQNKDSTAWGKTLAQMVLWGAPLTGAESDSLRAYLVTHFGPRP